MVSAKVLNVTKASSDFWELDFDLEGELPVSEQPNLAVWAYNIDWQWVQHWSYNRYYTEGHRKADGGGEGGREGSTMTFLLFIFLDLLLSVTAAILLWVQVFGDTVLLKADWNEAQFKVFHRILRSKMQSGSNHLSCYKIFGYTLF